MTPEQNKKFKMLFMATQELVVVDSVVTVEKSNDKHPTDQLQGTYLLFVAASKEFCTCGREDCKGVHVDGPQVLMMQ
jgi:hypothetical protein